MAWVYILKTGCQIAGVATNSSVPAIVGMAGLTGGD